MPQHISPELFADALRTLVDVEGLTKEAAAIHLIKEAQQLGKVAADQARVAVQGQVLYDSFFDELGKIASANTLADHETRNSLDLIEFARS